MHLWSRAAGLLALAAPIVSADDRMFQARSLQTCKGWDDGMLSVNLFDVTYKPSESMAMANIYAQFRYSGKIVLDLDLLVYGYTILTKRLDPCSFGVPTLCPIDFQKPLEFTEQSLPIDSKSLNIPSESTLGPSSLTDLC